MKINKTAFVIINKETRACFSYEDEDGCASFYKDNPPYLADKLEAEDILFRLKDKDNSYEIFESRDTVEENLNLMDEEAMDYIKQLEIASVKYEITL